MTSLCANKIDKIIKLKVNKKNHKTKQLLENNVNTISSAPN